MKTATIAALAFAILAPIAPALADEQADGTVQPISLPSGSFQYNITLQNPGDTSLGSFWFAWLPGYDFLPSPPTNVQWPAGWIANVISPEFAGDGYSIQWVANSPATSLAATQSLSGFSFTSSDDPSVIGGYSPIYYNYYLTTTSYAYVGPPESDPGAFFTPTLLATVSAAPEPTTHTHARNGIATHLVKPRRTTRTWGRRPRRPSSPTAGGTPNPSEFRHSSSSFEFRISLTPAPHRATSYSTPPHETPSPPAPLKHHAPPPSPPHPHSHSAPDETAPSAASAP